MNEVWEFIQGAAPMVIAGILFAVYASHQSTKGKNTDYSCEGMALGMGVGLLFGMLFNQTGTCMSLCMLAGLVSGSMKEKRIG